jgi:hypothetical protein
MLPKTPKAANDFNGENAFYTEGSRFLIILKKNALHEVNSSKVIGK